MFFLHSNNGTICEIKKALYFEVFFSWFFFKLSSGKTSTQSVQYYLFKLKQKTCYEDSGISYSLLFFKWVVQNPFCDVVSYDACDPATLRMRGARTFPYQHKRFFFLQGLLARLVMRTFEIV